MVKIFDQTNQNNKIAVRAVTLMNDLIIEKVRLKDYFSDFSIFII